MKNKFTKITTSVIATLTLGTFGFSRQAFGDCASNICECSNVPEEIKAASGCTSTIDRLDDTVVNILNAIIAVLGIVAVIVIIIGGISYMTSAGDPGKIKKAKDTILYACIGLIICVLSFAIVNFVINNIIG